jgi:hypothetical protein
MFGCEISFAIYISSLKNSFSLSDKANLLIYLTATISLVSLF